MLCKGVVGMMVMLFCCGVYGQNVVVEYQPQNVQYATTSLVPVTTVVNQTVWVPVVKIVPVPIVVVPQYNTYYPVAVPVNYHRCCFNSNYYIPYYHYRY
jgi:hypothetical protein